MRLHEEQQPEETFCILREEGWAPNTVTAHHKTETESEMGMFIKHVHDNSGNAVSAGGLLSLR